MSINNAKALWKKLLIFVKYGVLAVNAVTGCKLSAAAMTHEFVSNCTQLRQATDTLYEHTETNYGMTF